jgi:hypothetical protein
VSIIVCALHFTLKYGIIFLYGHHEKNHLGFMRSRPFFDGLFALAGGFCPGGGASFASGDARG